MPRLLDLGVEDYLLADVLRGVAGQRLVRRLCPDCARPSTPAEAERARTRHAGPSARRSTDREPAAGGSLSAARAAAGSGYRGRGRPVRDRARLARIVAGLREGADEDSLTAIAREEGFLSFGDDGCLKARRGETTLSEVYRIAGGGE